MARERGVLFQPGMVRAVLRPVDPKRQTRRLHPLGEVGDVLWCREAWRTDAIYNNFPPREVPLGAPVVYEADGTMQQPPIVEPWPVGKLRPSMFMCRWMSRASFLLTKVREEPLQAITQNEAESEGIVEHRKGGWHWEQPPEGIEGTNHFGFKTPRDAFAALWDVINGAGAWESNPTVFAHTFERIK